MPKANLKNILSSLYDGTQSLFVDYLGFPLKAVSSASFTLPSIASDYKSVRIYGDNVTDVRIIGLVPCDDSSLESQDLNQVKNGHAHITVIALELSAGFNPSLSWIKDYTRFIHNLFCNSPVLVAMTYAGEMLLSLPERRFNDRGVVERVSVLKDISLSNPSSHHQELLEKMKLSQSASATSKELCEGWMDKFARIDTELLVNDCKALFENEAVLVDWEELSSTITAYGQGFIGCEYNTLYDFILSDAFKGYHQDAVVYMQQLLRTPVEDFINKFGVTPLPEIISSWFTVEGLPLIDKSKANHFLKYDCLPYVEECLVESPSKSKKEVCLPMEAHSDEEVGSCLVSDVATLYDTYSRQAKLINKLLTENVIEDSVQAFMDLTPDQYFRISSLNKAKIKILKGIQAEVCEKANQVLSLCELDKNSLEAVYGDLLVDLPVVQPIISTAKNILAFLCGPQRLDMDLNKLTVGKIMTTRLIDILKLPNIRISRIHEVIHFRQMINNFFTHRKVLETTRKRLGPWYGKIQVSYHSTPLQLRKTLLDLLQGSIPTVEFFLSISEDRFKRSKLTSWLDFREKLIHSLSSLTIEAYLKGSSRYFRRPLPEQLSTNFLDFSICRDLTIFFDQIEEFSDTSVNKARDITIFRQRLGYNAPYKTLSQMADEFSCSLERIRQIEDSFYQKLRWVSSISSSESKQFIEEYPFELLKIKLPKLLELFQGNTNVFRAFIVKLTNADCWNSNIVNIKNEGPRLKYFWENSTGAMSKEDIVHFLQGQDIENEDEELTYTQASNLFIYLKERGELTEVEYNQYLPARLEVKTAVTFTLKGRPQGLGWREAYRLINQQNLTKNPIVEVRETPNPNHFAENASVFIAASTVNGTVYKHIDFFNQACGEDERNKILQEAVDYLNASGYSSVDLRTYHKQCQSNINYYILRHVIREYGQDYGLLWDGASRTDNFYLNNFSYERAITDDRVVELLDAHPSGLTKSEILAQLQHGHYILAVGTITRLYESGHLMKITSRYYGSSKNGLAKFGNKLEAVKKILKDIFDKQRDSDYLIEADYLKETVNDRLGTLYNKAIISSLAKYLALAGELDIHSKRQMFSYQELQYESMRDLVERNCEQNWEFWQVKAHLSKIVWTTDVEYARAWSSYKVSLK